jgi:hypothetical protein
MSIKLTETQRLFLNAAAKRDDHCIVVPPAAWFWRQASDGPADDLVPAMDRAWADAAG